MAFEDQWPHRDARVCRSVGLVYCGIITIHFSGAGLRSSVFLAAGLSIQPKFEFALELKAQR